MTYQFTALTVEWTQVTKEKDMGGGGRGFGEIQGVERVYPKLSCD